MNQYNSDIPLLFILINWVDKYILNIIIVFSDKNFLKMSDLFSRVGPAEAIGAYRDTRDALIRTSTSENY